MIISLVSQLTKTEAMPVVFMANSAAPYPMIFPDEIEIIENRKGEMLGFKVELLTHPVCVLLE